MEYIEADISEEKFMKLIEITEKKNIMLSKKQKQEMMERFLSLNKEFVIK